MLESGRMSKETRHVGQAAGPMLMENEVNDPDPAYMVRHPDTTLCKQSNTDWLIISPWQLQTSQNIKDGIMALIKYCYS